MIEYNKVNFNLSDSQLNKLQKCCQSSNRSNFKNENENV